MSTYGVTGGTLWGNRGAEAMVVTTIGRVRERDPGAAFVIFSYYPKRDRELLTDASVTVVDATPAGTIKMWIGAFLNRLVGLVGLRLPDALLPRSVRALRRCRAFFDVSGISFYDGRLPVVGYNLLSVWPALLLKVPVIRLAQAMGPFRKPLNRWPARWVTRRSLHTYARGAKTAEFMTQLGAPAQSWSVAPDVAFGYRAEFSLTTENDARVAEVGSRLARLRDTGTDVIAIVPSSLVNAKMTAEGKDYVGLLRSLIASLHGRGAHVLVMPNATRSGVDLPRNNDLFAIAQLRDRLAAEPEGIDPEAISIVDFDLNTASIRSLAEQCEVLITSRFHAMIAALALGVPPLVMGWSHKYAEVLEMFGCEENAVDFSQAEQRVPEMIERLLENRDTAREQILKALPGVVAASVAQFDQIERIR
jgi:polysaccharide pyruvyl transferase WcaK-like protein